MKNIIFETPLNAYEWEKIKYTISVRISENNYRNIIT